MSFLQALRLKAQLLQGLGDHPGAIRVLTQTLKLIPKVPGLPFPEARRIATLFLRGKP